MGHSLNELLNNGDKNTVRELIRYYFESATKDELNALAEQACLLRNESYGARVFFRGLIEFSNYCKNNCFYCGIRKGNKNVKRYRMSKDEILSCCQLGYSIGYRTFVLQGGEDVFFTDDILCSIVDGIKSKYPDCAVTLSAGERSARSYKKLYNAGADRYLLRHETADDYHYQALHPKELSLQNRKQCLCNLKDIGFQVGAGFMVNSPYQTFDTLAEDFLFLRSLSPHMVGIGPFVPSSGTKFSHYKTPSSENTLVILSLIRIMLPKLLLPATTALHTIDKNGRKKAFMCGANVVMPNLTPKQYRGSYALYDNKMFTGAEAAENTAVLVAEVKKNGLTPDFSRGDHMEAVLKRS